MAHHQSRRNAVLAGLFLVAGIGLFIAVVVVLADVELGSKRDYVVRFSLAEGAPGIESGSLVTVGGIRVGRVQGVELGPPGADRPNRVDVRIRIRADVPLYDNAVALLEQPVLGGLSTINIPRVGGDGDGDGSGRLQEGGTLEGRIPPPRFLRQAGFNSDAQRQVRSVIDSADRLVKRLSELSERSTRIVERLEPEIGPAAADARRTIEDLRSVVADIRQRRAAWMARIDTMLRDAASFAERLGPAIEETRGGVDEARGVIADLDAAIEANRPGVDRTVRNLAEASRRLNDQTIPEAERFLGSLNSQADAIERTVGRVDELLAEQEPQIRHTMGNLRLASDQLKLAMIEIRAQPWRLLVRPSKRQFEQELVYDAARTYAEAVGDLRAASESLESTLARREAGDAGGAAPTERIDRITSELNEAFQRYQDAERTLLDRLIGSDD